MSVGVATTKVTYDMDGVTVSFPITFDYLSVGTNVKARTLNETTGGEVELAYGTDYTVVAGNVVVADPQSSSYKLIIYRGVPYTQETDWLDNDELGADALEGAADHGVELSQQLLEQVKRSIRGSLFDTEDMDPLPLASLRAGCYLYFDDTGQPTVVSEVAAGSLAVTPFAETLLDDASAGDWLTTLGVSAFIQTLLDDSSAAVARTTLGMLGDITLGGDITIGDALTVTGAATLQSTLAVTGALTVETVKATDGDGLKLFEDSGTYGITVLDTGSVSMQGDAGAATLVLGRVSNNPSIRGKDDSYGKTIVVDPYTAGDIWIGYYTKAARIGFNTAGGHAEFAGDDTISSEPTAIATNAWGWKIGLYSSGYYIGAAPYTVCMAAPWLSGFYTSAWPQSDANNIYQPDSGSRWSLGVYGIYHGSMAVFQGFLATNNYTSLTNNLYYRSGWKRITASSEAMVFYMSRSVGDATGYAEWVGRITTDSGTTRDGNATMETVWLVSQAGNATAANRAVTLAMGGGAGGSNRDVSIDLATDASLMWDESESKVVAVVPSGGALALKDGSTEVFGVSASALSLAGVCGFSSSATTLNMAASSVTANVYHNSSTKALVRNSSSARYKKDIDRLQDAARILTRLSPVTFLSKCEVDDPTILRYGLIAEEVHALGLPGLVNYLEQDGKQIPDGVQYPSIVPILITGWQDHEARIAALESAVRGVAKS